MINNDILDAQPTKHDISSSKEIIAWWERKRLVYNLIIILCSISFSMLGKWPIRYYVLDHLLLVAPIHLFLANIFYSFGWGGELLINYYIPTFKLPSIVKYFIYIGGVLFSILVTYIVADSILGFRWD